MLLFEEYIADRTFDLQNKMPVAAFLVFEGINFLLAKECLSLWRTGTTN